MLVNHYRITLYQNARFFIIILLVVCLGCGPLAMLNNVISVQYVINISYIFVIIRNITVNHDSKLAEALSVRYM